MKFGGNPCPNSPFRSLIIAIEARPGITLKILIGRNFIEFSNLCATKEMTSKFTAIARRSDWTWPRSKPATSEWGNFFANDLRRFFAASTTKWCSINFAEWVSRLKNCDRSGFECDSGLPQSLLSNSERRIGQGFSAKLHIDRLAPTSKTLFIDADCLCVGPLHSLFDRLGGKAVTVVGSEITKGDWFGDVTGCLAFWSNPDAQI